MQQPILFHSYCTNTLKTLSQVLSLGKVEWVESHRTAKGGEGLVSAWSVEQKAGGLKVVFGWMESIKNPLK